LGGACNGRQRENACEHGDGESAHLSPPETRGDPDHSLRLSPVILRCEVYVNTAACGAAFRALAGNMPAGSTVLIIEAARSCTA